MKGYRVLAVDIDPQASLTTLFGYRPELDFLDSSTIYDAIRYDDPLPFLRQIGSAPGIGRDRWMALARALERDGVRSSVSAFMRGPDFIKGESDARFEAVYKRATSQAKTPRPASRAPCAARMVRRWPTSARRQKASP